MPEDRLQLRGIRFHGYHGTTEEEKTLGRMFCVDVDILCDTRKAAREDRLEDTIDYAGVFSIVSEIGRGSHFLLLETLADRLASRLLDHFAIPGVWIRVTKLSPPIQGSVDSVGIEITRFRENPPGAR
ncbi:MAG: dihydroneopterin aldolase [Planctomycetes bacterium]|nr:dihydroneopterin aldolase [Planctomycetota bacterium]